MRVISYKMIRDFGRARPDALGPLDDWYDVAAAAEWKNIADVRRNFPHADAVKVASGNTVTVFNVKGNKYRLIAGIKYTWSVIYLLSVMTHAEYDKGRWKDQL